VQTRIDHRSYERRGVNREPASIVPAKVFYAERQSQMSTAAAGEIRARYREKREYRQNRTHRKPRRQQEHDFEL
jgi:hypothetical protein